MNVFKCRGMIRRFSTYIERVDRAIVTKLVEAAICAPSGGNAQPWSFQFKDTLKLYEREEPSFLDYEKRATRIGIGAAIENIFIRSQALGLNIEMVGGLYPDPFQSRLVCEFSLKICSTSTIHELDEMIEKRCTNRHFTKRQKISSEIFNSLLEDVFPDHQLRIASEPSDLKVLSKVFVNADRLRLLHPEMHADCCKEMRWTPEEARLTSDGVDIDTLELKWFEKPGLKFLQNHSLLQKIDSVGLGFALGDISRKWINGSSAVGCIHTTASDTPSSWINSGRVMQRVWMKANQMGLAYQPMNILPFIWPRLDKDGEGLTSEFQAGFTDLQSQFRMIFPSTAEGNYRETHIFRLGIAPPPSIRAYRKPVGFFLEFI